MMMVETELRPSNIHGLGVFLLEPVKAGGLIWRFDSRIDRVYAPAEITSLPGHVQRYLKTYCTWHEGAGLYVLCGDNGRYFNHAARPSTVSDAISFGEDHAARDLAVGEELTSDYATICDEVRRAGADFSDGQRKSPAKSRGSSGDWVRGHASVAGLGSRSGSSPDV